MTAPVSSLSAVDLTPTARAALLALERRDMLRVRHGWLQPGSRKRWSLALADRLKAQGLAREDVVNFRRKLTITGSGRQLAAVLQERKQA